MFKLFKKFLLCIFALSCISAQASASSGAVAQTFNIVAKMSVFLSACALGYKCLPYLKYYLEPVDEWYMERVMHKNKVAEYWDAQANPYQEFVKKFPSPAHILNEIEKHDRSVDQMQQARERYYNQLIGSPWGTVAQKYIKQFAAHESKCIGQLLQLLGLRFDQWQKFRTVAHDYIEQNIRQHFGQAQLGARFIPQERMNFIKNILRYVGIDPHCIAIGRASTSKVHIHSINKTIEACMLSTDRSILISDGVLLDKAQLYDEEFRVNILHEIQHILHNDFSNRVLMALLKDLSSNADEDDYNSLSLTWERLQEKRADILGCLFDLNCAKNCLSDFSHVVLTDDQSQDDEPVYRSPLECKKYMQQLCKEMQDALDAKSKIDVIAKID